MRGFDVQTYGSRFQIMMAARHGKDTIVRYNADGSDAGLYLHGFVNDFRTSLAARGSAADLERLVRDLRA